MNDAWLILTRRYGSDEVSPSDADLRKAVKELFHESAPGMTEADYAEHDSASLRLGYDDGPMYVIEITRLGKVIFEEWADQDFNEELSPPRTMLADEKRAFTLWTMLKQNQVAEIRQAFPESI